jgi:hypothetical protein
MILRGEFRKIVDTGLRLYRSAHQLCVPRARGVDDERSRQGDGARFLTLDQPA